MLSDDGGQQKLYLLEQAIVLLFGPHTPQRQEAENFVNTHHLATFTSLFEQTKSEQIQYYCLMRLDQNVEQSVELRRDVIVPFILTQCCSEKFDLSLSKANKNKLSFIYYKCVVLDYCHDDHGGHVQNQHQREIYFWATAFSDIFDHSVCRVAIQEAECQDRQRVEMLKANAVLKMSSGSSGGGGSTSSSSTSAVANNITAPSSLASLASSHSTADAVKYRLVELMNRVLFELSENLLCEDAAFRLDTAEKRNRASVCKERIKQKEWDFFVNIWMNVLGKPLVESSSSSSCTTSSTSTQNSSTTNSSATNSNHQPLLYQFGGHQHRAADHQQQEYQVIAANNARLLNLQSDCLLAMKEFIPWVEAVKVWNQTTIQTLQRLMLSAIERRKKNEEQSLRLSDASVSTCGSENNPGFPHSGNQTTSLFPVCCDVFDALLKRKFSSENQIDKLKALSVFRITEFFLEQLADSDLVPTVGGISNTSSDVGANMTGNQQLGVIYSAANSTATTPNVVASSETAGMIMNGSQQEHGMHHLRLIQSQNPFEEDSDLWLEKKVEVVDSLAEAVLEIYVNLRKKLGTYNTNVVENKHKASKKSKPSTSAKMHPNNSEQNLSQQLRERDRANNNDINLQHLLDAEGEALRLLGVLLPQISNYFAHPRFAIANSVEEFLSEFFREVEHLIVPEINYAQNAGDHLPQGAGPQQSSSSSSTTTAGQQPPPARRSGPLFTRQLLRPVFESLLSSFVMRMALPSWFSVHDEDDKDHVEFLEYQKHLKNYLKVLLKVDEQIVFRWIQQECENVGTKYLQHLIYFSTSNAAGGTPTPAATLHQQQPLPAALLVAPHHPEAATNVFCGAGGRGEYNSIGGMISSYQQLQYLTDPSVLLVSSCAAVAATTANKSKDHAMINQYEASPSYLRARQKEFRQRANYDCVPAHVVSFCVWLETLADLRAKEIPTYQTSHPLVQVVTYLFSEQFLQKLPNGSCTSEINFVSTSRSHSAGVENNAVVHADNNHDQIRSSSERGGSASSSSSYAKLLDQVKLAISDLIVKYKVIVEKDNGNSTGKSLLKNVLQFFVENLQNLRIRKRVAYNFNKFVKKIRSSLSTASPTAGLSIEMVNHIASAKLLQVPLEVVTDDADDSQENIFEALGVVTCGVDGKFTRDFFQKILSVPVQQLQELVISEKFGGNEQQFFTALRDRHLDSPSKLGLSQIQLDPVTAAHQLEPLLGSYCCRLFSCLSTFSKPFTQLRPDLVAEWRELLVLTEKVHSQFEAAHKPEVKSAFRVFLRQMMRVLDAQTLFEALSVLLPKMYGVELKRLGNVEEGIRNSCQSGGGRGGSSSASSSSFNSATNQNHNQAPQQQQGGPLMIDSRNREAISDFMATQFDDIRDLTNFSSHLTATKEIHAPPGSANPEQQLTSLQETFWAQNLRTVFSLPARYLNFQKEALILPDLGSSSAASAFVLSSSSSGGGDLIFIRQEIIDQLLDFFKNLALRCPGVLSQFLSAYPEDVFRIIGAMRLGETATNHEAVMKQTNTFLELCVQVVMRGGETESESRETPLDARTPGEQGAGEQDRNQKAACWWKTDVFLRHCFAPIFQRLLAETTTGTTVVGSTTNNSSKTPDAKRAYTEIGVLVARDAGIWGIANEILTAAGLNVSGFLEKYRIFEAGSRDYVPIGKHFADEMFRL
ncbi:unnamed protein product [Amoebophrya sp. A120]|nr:unnamed protein product [Amoebophrya sp. A120]|eukprot:GSA120T00007520001.1